MEANKNPTCSKIKNIYIESNIDINCKEDSAKSYKINSDKIGLKQLIKDYDKTRLEDKDLKEINKYLVKTKDKLALENIKLKEEIQKYKDEQIKKNNQIIQPSKEINLIIINKDETKKNLYEAIERLNEELKLKDKEIKFIKSIKDEALRQIIMNNVNLVLKDGKKESEEILTNLKKHNPKLYPNDDDNDDNDDKDNNQEEDRNSENIEVEDISMNQNLLNNNNNFNNNINNNESPVDRYIASKNNLANNQYNNIEDFKTQDVTENSRPVPFNNQTI